MFIYDLEMDINRRIISGFNYELKTKQKTNQIVPQIDYFLMFCNLIRHTLTD